jgi:arginase family enzyme
MPEKDRPRPPRRRPPTEAPAVAVIFPFDLFGSAGSGAGAELVADELREILADNHREQTPTRARAYEGRLRLRQFAFEKLGDLEGWRQQGRRAARQVLDRGEFLLWVAGNHLGVLPVYEELGAGTVVVQLDAHLDIHHFRDCTRELSHGNFLRHAEGPRPAVVNVGHRELLLRGEDIRAYYRATLSAEALAVDLEGALKQLRQTARGARRVFLDLDCDVFDPAFFPAVTQPVPFGLGPAQVLRVLDAAWSERVVGLAVSEFDPGRDRNDMSLAALMWLIEHLLLRRYEKRAAD